MAISTAGLQVPNMSNLKTVLAEMVGSYSDLAVMARSQIVDAYEVAQAISDADPNSAEMVALQALAKCNPVTSQTSAEVQTPTENTED